MSKKIAIIGSGPAGLTAAIYTSRANLQTFVFTGNEPGGQLTTTTEIENFPGFAEGIMGPLLMENMRKQAERFGTQVLQKEIKNLEMGENRKFKVIDNYNESDEYDAIIIASGASARYLGLQGEERFIGKGYHSCATCDGFFYRGKNIIVVGGGDSAMEEANFLSKFADNVTILNRTDNFRASKIMLERTQNNPKVKIEGNKSIVQLIGEDKLSSVKIRDNNSGNVEERQIDGVFVAIGHNPNTNFVNGSIARDELGYLVRLSEKHFANRLENDDQIKLATKFKTMSEVAGIFLAGDVNDHIYRQAITAAGEGAKAAIDCERWIETKLV